MADPLMPDALSYRSDTEEFNSCIDLSCSSVYADLTDFEARKNAVLSLRLLQLTKNTTAEKRLLRTVSTILTGRYCECSWVHPRGSSVLPQDKCIRS